MLAQMSGHSPMAAEAAAPLLAAAVVVAVAVVTLGMLAVTATAGVDKPAGATGGAAKIGVAEMVATCAAAPVEPPIAKKQAAAMADAGPAPMKRVNIVPV
jgi:adenosylcobinamide amidohydrolase